MQVGLVNIAASDFVHRTFPPCLCKKGGGQSILHRPPPCDINRLSVADIWSTSPLGWRNSGSFGNTSIGCAFSLIGISPPRGSHRAALIACGGLRQACRFTLGLWLDGSIIISLCLSSPTERVRRTVWALPHNMACRGADRQQRGCNGCAVWFNYQGTHGRIKTPSLSMVKSEGVAHPKFLIS